MNLAPELPVSSYVVNTVASAPATARIAECGRAFVWLDPDGKDEIIDAEARLWLLAADAMRRNSAVD